METLAFDLGASSGRAVIGLFDGTKLHYHIVHRFSNEPVWVGGKFHWDILRLYHEIKTGILKAHSAKSGPLRSMAIDSWALDFGLLDKDGELLGNPLHYRDPQNAGMMEEVFQFIPKETLFKQTGIQFMQINSIYQLYAMKRSGSTMLDNAKRFLMIPDLLRYFLTGQAHNEFTNATTTQMVDHASGQWHADIIRKLGIDDRIFGPLLHPGVNTGSLQRSVCSELSIAPIPVVSVGEHDTASAVVAVPAEGSSFAYLSCGTWSLLGTEVPKPVVNDLALRWNFTNEGGIGGTFRLLKNIMGLWIIQECKRAWEKEGACYSYTELTRMAAAAPSIRSFIDPDAPAFLNPSHMPEQIRAYCRSTQQPVPVGAGEIIRCALESLALKYRLILERTERLSGARFSCLHVVGGGANNELLCQLTSNAIVRPVLAGPDEATAIGNMMMQYAALEEVSSLADIRSVVRGSVAIREFEPQHTELWNEAYAFYVTLINETDCGADNPSKVD